MRPRSASHRVYGSPNGISGERGSGAVESWVPPEIPATGVVPCDSVPVAVPVFCGSPAVSVKYWYQQSFVFSECMSLKHQLYESVMLLCQT